MSCCNSLALCLWTNHWSFQNLSFLICRMVIYVNPWLIHVNVWQNLLQYCKVISLQLIKNKNKKRKKKDSLPQATERIKWDTPVLKKVGKTTRPFKYGLNQMLYSYTVEVRNRFKGLDMIDKSAWRTMDGGSWHCTGDSDQDHPQEKEMQKTQNGYLRRPYK